MRKILAMILLPLAVAVLKKYQPLVIAVAGTVGKTSTKNAIAAALGKTKIVRASEKNNNTEIGSAVTVLGASAAGKNVLGWLRVFWQGLVLLAAKDKSYPAILVLEFGEQRPGDLARLAGLFPPRIVVLTAIGATHGEFLGGIKGIEREFETLIKLIPADGAAVLNSDDSAVIALALCAKAKVVKYGLAEGAAVRGIEPHPLIRRDEKRALFVDGMAFKIEFDGNVIPVQIPGALGLPPVFAALAACAVSAALALNPMVAIEGLRDFKASKGRLRVLDGIKFSSLIDDSYNASTGSMIEALRALRSVPLDEGESRIAVLGEMREMGAASEAEHRRVGASVVEFEVDRLVTVGEMARDILRGALEAGFPKERGVHFAAALEAGRFVQGILERGDTVLIKGSRGAHLERITRELMAEPLRAEELLEFGEPTT